MKIATSFVFLDSDFIYQICSVRYDCKVKGYYSKLLNAKALLLLYRICALVKNALAFECFVIWFRDAVIF